MLMLQENNRFASLSLRACAALFFLAAPAYAENCYSQYSGDWDDAGIWNTQRNGSGESCTPGDAIIQPGHTIDVDTAVSVNSLSVEDGASGYPAILDMQASGILLVRDSVDVEDTQAVDGVFRFSATSGTKPILRAAGVRVYLDGPFTVTGSRGATFDRTIIFTFELLSGGSITSDSGTVLISAPIDNDGTITATGGNIAIIGLVLDGSTGTFSADGGNMVFPADVNNDGTIEAKGGSDVTFSGTINAGSSGFFKVTAAGSDMNFSLSAAATITGGADFLVTGGRLFIQEGVETNGGYKQTGGKIEVAAGKTFKCTGAYP